MRPDQGRCGSPLIGKLNPGVKVVDDQRFVDNGKIITTAGLSSGIDGALHVLGRMRGEGNAQAAALGIEYDWRPDSGFARAALADRLIPQIDLDKIGKWDPGDSHEYTTSLAITREG